MGLILPVLIENNNYTEVFNMSFFPVKRVYERSKNAVKKYLEIRGHGSQGYMINIS